MPLTFVPDTQSDAAPQSSMTFVPDEPAVAQYSFEVDKDAKPIPPEAADVATRMQDPAYMPTPAEFEAWRAHEKEKPWFQPNEWATRTIDAAKGIKDTVVKGAKAMFTSKGLLINPVVNGLPSYIEGAARGTAGDLAMGKKVLENLTTGFGAGGTGLNEAQYIAVKLAQVNNAAFPQGVDANTTLLTRQDVPDKTLQAWKEEFKNSYKPQEDYQNFIGQRQQSLAAIQTAQAQAQGKENLAPEWLGKPDNDVANAGSLVESPASLATFGGGAEAKLAATLLERGAGAGAQVAGKALSAAGRVGEVLADLPVNATKAGIETVTGTGEAGEKVAEQVGKYTGVVTAPVATAAKTVGTVGDAMQAAGRAVSYGPSRTGMLGLIASDGAAPKWLRNAAYAARYADPALGMAGDVAQSAVHGAAIGGALGALSEGDADGVFGGIGSGAALGAGFGAAGRLLSGKAQLEAKRQADLNRWFAGKTPEEQLNIARMGLSSDDALKYATLEQLAQGMRGEKGEGDLKFVYTDDATFQKAFGGSAKGAEFVAGDRPTVVVNVDRADVGTLPHEVFHGLLDLAVDPVKKAELTRRLFSQTAPDGTPLTEGIFSAEDQARAEDQYVSRLHEAGKAEWATLTPEQRQAKLRGELAADAFANLVRSQGPDYLLKGLSGPRRRMADALIQASDSSMLGRLREGLKRVGVTFDTSGAPSELFVKGGRPVTNSPQVDAALRDYLRAKERVRDRLSASDDAPTGTVVTKQDLLSKNAKVIAGLYGDNDNYAKDAAGQVKFSGGQPVLLTEGQIKTLQSKRVDAMLAALDAVPDDGTPRAVRKKDNGAYEGGHFTDAQLDALDRVAPEVLPPSLKNKLRELNQYHRANDGRRFILDYNAATKEAKGGGRVYSSGIRSTLRDVVPISIHISKAGNFYSTGMDATVLFAKMTRWFKEKPRAFDAWGGDRDAVMRDLFKYLDNHANGREGSVGLDAGAATAVHKKNVLNDLFGVARGTGNNPIELSVKGGKDQLVRSFRFDRTNRITESGGDKLPFDYQKQKVNFLPEEPAEPKPPVEIPGLELLPAPRGGSWTATTPIAGVPVKGKYEVHEAKDLVSSFDKRFDPALQPRDRSRAASVNQIASIVQKFEPQRLGEAPTTDMGAPVVDELNQVLSGNGRTASLRTLYGAENPAKAQAYKEYLVRNAGQFGLKPSDIETMSEPVLVRKVEDYGGLSKTEFARQSNQSQLLAMSGAEKASADARMLTETPGLLDKFAPSEEGNVLAETNREFLNHFIQGTGDSAELLTEKGYNQEVLRKRVETAVMATILGPEHRDLITKLVERSDKYKIRKAVNGVMQSGAHLVKLKGTPYDLGGHLQEALANLIRLRGSGEKVETFLASRALIGGSDRTAAGDHVLEFLAKAKSMRQVAEDLGRYFLMAKNAIEDAQFGGMFGDQPKTREQLVAEIYGKLTKDNPQYPGPNGTPNQPVAESPGVAGAPAPVAQPPGPGNPVPTPGPAIASAPAAAPVVTAAPAPTATPPPSPVAKPVIVTRPQPPGPPAVPSRSIPRAIQLRPAPGAYRRRDEIAQVSPQAITRHTQAQTIASLAEKITAGGVRVSGSVRNQLATYFAKRLDAASRPTGPDQRTGQVMAVANLAARVTPQDVSAISQALRSSGLNGARATIDQQARLKVALTELRLPASKPTSRA